MSDSYLHANKWPDRADSRLRCPSQFLLFPENPFDAAKDFAAAAADGSRDVAAKDFGIAVDDVAATNVEYAVDDAAAKERCWRSL